MNADELRAIQAPLKARAKDDPASARITLRAEGRIDQAHVTCAITSGKPGVPAGLHPATGGDGTTACSADMLLEALVGCAGVTMAAVATAMSIALDEATVKAEGEVDFRGTLGVTRDAPVGFTAIRLSFTIRSAAPDEKLAKLVELSERYCVVLQTIAKSAPVTARFQRP